MPWLFRCREFLRHEVLCPNNVKSCGFQPQFDGGDTHLQRAVDGRVCISYQLEPGLLSLENKDISAAFRDSTSATSFNLSSTI